MAIRDFDGFEDDALRAIWQTPPGSYGVGTYGRFGGGSRVGDTHNVSAHYRYATARATILFGWACYINDGSPGEKVVRIGNSSDAVLDSVELRYDSANTRLTIHDAAGTQQGATSNGSLPVQEWHYVEVKTTCHDTTGSVEVHIDGVQEANVTSIDTKGGATATFDDVRYGALGGSDIDSMWMDDMYWADTVEDFTGEDVIDFTGGCRVYMSYPDGNGNSSVLVGQDTNSTDNYLNVDETTVTPDGDTTYNGGGTEGDKDTYSMDDIDTTLTVLSVAVTNWAKKTDAGTKHGRNVLRRSGTDYVGTSEALTTDYVGYLTLFNQDPSDDTQWLASEVNGVEAGFEVRDS